MIESISFSLFYFSSMLKVQSLINQISENRELKDSQKESAISALKRIENNAGANFVRDESEIELLTEAFLWERSVEGPEFWSKIHKALVR